MLRQYGYRLIWLLCLLATGVGMAEPTLRMVYFHDFRPLSYQAPDATTVNGVWVDIATELARRNGIAVKHEAYPWARAQAMVKEGLADGFITTINPERLAYSAFCNVLLLSAENRVFTYAGHPQLAELDAIRSIDDLKPFSIVNYLGNGWVKSHLTSHHIEWRATNLEAAKLLALRRYDLTVESVVTMNALLSENGLTGKLVPVGTPLERYEYFLFIGKKSPFAESLPEFTKTLDAMQHDGTIAKILAKHGIKR